MARALWFLIKVAIVVAIAVWLAERPGTVAIAWQGWVVETSVGVAVLVTVAALGLAALLYRLWRAVWGGPSSLRRYRRTRRRERGYQALTKGLVAVAAGDAGTARSMARKADGLLNEPPLTMLLSAQAAQLTGDDAAARRYFTAMLERPETAFLGLRGLLTQALRKGDRVEALTLARRARQIQPDTPWLLATLYDLEARSGDWAAAEATLEAAVRAGAVTPEDGRHHRAALLLERSFEAERRGRSDSALHHARAAHDLLPGFVPAAARLAGLLAGGDRLKQAAKVVERTWRLLPHPELADVYRQVLEGYDPLARVKMFQKLLSQSPNHVESHLALARACLDAKLWGEARTHLTKAMELQPSRRIHRLLAELERGEHQDEDAARAWLVQAASAPADPAWTCRSCGAVSRDWAGLCGHCSAFDSLDWKQPTVALHPAPADAVTGPAPALPTAIGTLPAVPEPAR
ncbi:heme biosynthesis protein HemY [Azospirillum halopraeferens]|uniref:heme biosynthesis protein HemY n=1 Tax=Azospirillum halopraeferens TaxID=34010 RepID=UPI0004246691|nr:heme biosynthesis HemY N-terminal domain-containing protein [Azospirillum halopraeferens]